MLTLPFTDIFDISSPKSYKVHLANDNGHCQPLDVFVRDRHEWQRWNEWRSEKDDFNRQYIFSLIDFYHEPDTWLFGGVYEVLERSNVTRAYGYKVELTEQFSGLIGRLKIHWKRSGRAKARKLENCLEAFEVDEILREPYSGDTFCGYENIHHPFHKLEVIFTTGKPDWKAALQNIKGIYLISDKSNGMTYIGKADGGEGIWSRWSDYLHNGHGGNTELKAVIQEKGIDHARDNFYFALLEYYPKGALSDDINKREAHWKRVLESRRYGYNGN